MSTALAKVPPTAVGAAGTSTALVRAPRNPEGLTYKTWLDRARVKTSAKAHKAWEIGEDPANFKKESAKLARAANASNAMENPGIGGWSTPTKIAVGVGVGVGVIALITGAVYLVKRAKGPRWKRAEKGVIPPGAAARLAIPQSSLATLGITLDAPALAKSLTTVNELSSTKVFAPGDPTLPADWPKDDVNAASELHIQFRNATGNALNPQAGIPGILPAVPMTVWIYG